MGRVIKATLVALLVNSATANLHFKFVQPTCDLANVEHPGCLRGQTCQPDGVYGTCSLTTWGSPLTDITAAANPMKDTSNAMLNIRALLLRLCIDGTASAGRITEEPFVT